MVCVPVLEVSATLVAVTVTLALGVGGRMVGAVNSPVAEMAPQAEPEQPLPATLQVTFVFGLPPPGLVTAAANCSVAPSSTFGVVGVTLTTTSLVTVTVAEPEAVVSAVLVARMVTCAGEGRIAGAV